MKQIPIKRRNGTIEYFFVSDEDTDWVRQWKWHTLTSGYISRSGRKSDGDQGKQILLHRALMERLGHDLTGLVVDHMDYDVRNNCRDNLRVCTNNQNSAAQRTRSYEGKASHYRGVSWYKALRKWMAYVQINGRQKYLGVFVNEDDAARAYNAAALTQWGEFAVLNDVPAIQLELPFAA